MPIILGKIFFLKLGIFEVPPYSPPKFFFQKNDKTTEITSSNIVWVLSRVWLFETTWTGAQKPPLSIVISRQEYWSGLPFPSLNFLMYLTVKTCIESQLSEKDMPSCLLWPGNYVMFITGSGVTLWNPHGHVCLELSKWGIPTNKFQDPKLGLTVSFPCF